jgi:hypothetical protein
MSNRRKGPITAQELLAQLEADPEWVANRDAREKEQCHRKAEIAKHERKLVTEVCEIGYEIDSVWDLVNNAPHPILERKFIGPYVQAYPILIRHLKLPYIREVREGIIRALTVKDGGAELEEALLDEFYKEQDPILKWVLGNALQTAMPYHRRRKHPEIREALKRSY